MASRVRTYHDWADWFRACARCHTPTLFPIDIFCEHCERELNIRSFPVHCESETKPSFQIHAQYDWNAKNDSLLRPLVYGLKGGRQSQAFLTLAERFSFHLSESRLGPVVSAQLSTELSPLVFIPPPRRSASPDHAFCWGKALSGIWNFPLIDALVWDDDADCEGATRKTSTQKRKSRLERRQRKFKPGPLSEAIPAQAGVIFVDDVVTTGATAEAAYVALGRPKPFVVWAIAYRAKLAGNGRV